MPIRFAVVGTAHWAETVHIPGLQSRSDVELVGVWGRNAERSRNLAGISRIRAFENFDEMLGVVDAVSFAVPPDVQTSLALAAAEAGKHLLLEKPVSMSVSGAQAIAEMIDRYKLASVVFFMRRFIPPIERMVQEASHRVWRNANVRIHSAAMSSQTPYTNSVWRQAEAAVLWDMGPHPLSILIPVLGPVGAIRATYGANRILTMSTSHAGGVDATLSLTLHADPSETGSEYVFQSNLDEIRIVEPTFSRTEAFAMAAGDLICNIKDQKTAHPCDVHLGTQVVAILAAAARSIERGGTSEIP